MADPGPAPSSPFNVQQEERTVKVYSLTEDEIEHFATFDHMATYSVALVSTFLSSAITFWLTADWQATYATGVLAVLVVATVASALAAYWTISNSRQRKTRIIQRANPKPV